MYGNASDPIVYLRLVQELEWILSVVHSRTFGPAVTGRWAAMIPLFDLCNHANDGGASVRHDLRDTFTNAQNKGNGRLYLIADKSFAVGQEIFIPYFGQ